MCIEFAERIPCPACGNHEIWEGYHLYRCMRQRAGQPCELIYMKQRLNQFRADMYISYKRDCRPRPPYQRVERSVPRGQKSAKRPRSDDE